MAMRSKWNQTLRNRRKIKLRCSASETQYRRFLGVTKRAPSISNDCRASGVGILATVAFNVTSATEEVELVPLLTEQFRRSLILRISLQAQAAANKNATPKGDRTVKPGEKETMTTNHPHDACSLFRVATSEIFHSEWKKDIFEKIPRKKNCCKYDS